MVNNRLNPHTDGTPLVWALLNVEIPAKVNILLPNTQTHRHI